MDHLLVKTVHQTAAMLSVAGFAARSAGSLAGAAWVKGRVAKTLPHVVDTVLLAAALMLAWRLKLNPLATPWLLAKIVALLGYVLLGRLALQRQRPRGLRIAASVLALATFAYIVSVAVTRQPQGLLRWL